MTIYVRLFCFSILLLGLLFTNGSAVEQSHGFSSEIDQLPASDLHKMMAERKAVQLEKSRAAARILADEPQRDQTNYDVGFYDISIRVNDTTEILEGVVKIVAKAAVDGVSQVEVDLQAEMIADSLVAPSGLLAYTRSGNVVTVTLDQSFLAGETFEFDFWYHGHPTEGGLKAFAFDTYNGEPSISSLSEPYFSRSWWPCKDRNDDKADSFKTHITVDSSLYCASNGDLDSVTSAGNRETFHYTMRYPMVTYLFSVAIAPFTIWSQDYVFNGGADTMPIIHHTYSNWYNTSLTSGWSQSPEIMSILSDNYGPYPFLDHKYGHANFEWGGGMEHQTLTSMGASSFGFSTNVTVHEMGHQWWGDMITCKSWEDIWLNEGWASYTEALYHLAVSGWPAYHSYMAGMDYYGGGTIWVDDTTDVWRIFNGNLSYDKGAWVCHMLRGVLGEFKFFAGVDAYYNSEFKYGAANTEDFKNVFEAATGEELDWFFDEWIYGTYYPDYEYSYFQEPSDTGGYDVYLYIDQTQNTMPRVFHMPVDLFFNQSSGPDDTLTLKIEQDPQLFRLNRPTSVSQILLDPSDWILKQETQVSWTMHILSIDGELSDGNRSAAYIDTVQFRGGTGSSTVAVISGALPPGLNINNSAIISGVPSDTGTYSFRVRVYNSGTGYSDEASFTMHIGPALTCCTGPSRGNVDGSVDNLVTMGDLTVLIDHLFISLEPLACIDEGNVDLSADDLVTMGDLTVLIDHLFIDLNPLPACP